MPISEIRDYVELICQGDATIRERHKVISKQLGRVKEEIKEFKGQAKTLEDKLKYYEAKIAGGDGACRPFFPV